MSTQNVTKDSENQNLTRRKSVIQMKFGSRKARELILKKDIKNLADLFFTNVCLFVSYHHHQS